jgi:hypothetical protein
MQQSQDAQKHQATHQRINVRRSLAAVAVVLAAAVSATGLTATVIDLTAASPPASGSARGLLTGLHELARSGSPAGAAVAPESTTPLPTPTTTPITLPGAGSKAPLPPVPAPTVPVATGTTLPTTTVTTQPTKRPGEGLNGPMAGQPSPTVPVVTATVPAPVTTVQVPSASIAMPPVPAVTTTTAPVAAPTPTGAAAAGATSAGCNPDPAPAIAALPQGGTFHGVGCYLTNGILITQPNVTIDGGTYTNLTAPPQGDVKPLIRIKDVTNVTVKNVTLNGVNVRGGFHRDLVGEEGVQVLSSSDVTLTNVATNDTFGDGLIFGFQPGHPPSTDITVNGYTITNAGRLGVTVAYLTNSTLNGVNIVSSADVGWNFESDGPGIGSGNVTVNNASGTKGIRFIEALQGPITFNNCQCQRHVTLMGEAAASGQQVTFIGGRILLPNSDHGPSPGGVTVRGPGNLTFVGVTLGRLPATWSSKGPAWSVAGGGHLTLVKSPVTAPLGVHDASSTVTIVG